MTLLKVLSLFKDLLDLVLIAIDECKLRASASYKNDVKDHVKEYNEAQEKQARIDAAKKLSNTINKRNN